MQSLCHHLKEEHDIGANFYLVGSGAKNLILQNDNNPVDLDYNLEIIRCADFNDCEFLKECARKAFNKALQEHGLRDCEDSTSSLTSKRIDLKYRHYTNLPFRSNECFSIDVCITKRDSADAYYRLIHEKTGWAATDRYYWNCSPNSKKIRKKVEFIKSNGKWTLVREQYKSIKNMYLKRNDHDHPSFVCYIEAVNNVYNSMNHRKRGN